MGVAESLKSVKDELDKSEAAASLAKTELDKAQKVITDNTKLRNDLSTKIAVLKKDGEELSASHAAIEAARNAVDAGASDLEKFIKNAVAQFDKKAPKNVSAKTVENAVKAIDSVIADKQKAVDDLRQMLSTAEDTLKAAQSEATNKENAAADYKKQLNSLTSDIKTAQSRVATLKTSIDAAVKSGQATEGYYLVKQLNDAVQDLKKLTESKREEELVGQQRDSWQKATTAKQNVAKCTEERDKLQQQLTAAEQEYQAKLKARESDIKAKLDGLPDGEPQADKGEPASTGGAGASDKATQYAASKVESEQKA